MRLTGSSKTASRQMLTVKYFLLITKEGSLVLAVKWPEV